MSNIKNIISAIHNLHKKGQLLTNEEVIEILKATKLASENKKLINSFIFFLTTLNTKSVQKLQNLTNRELQILYLIGLGKQSNDIAKQLDLKITTIETHRKNIRKKLNLVGKGKLIEFAILNNLQQNTSFIK